MSREFEIYTRRYMKIYRISFKSMSELYLFLKEEPEINSGIFKSLHSLTGDEDFAGVPYENALEYCIGGYEGDYGVVLEMQRELEKCVPVKVRSRRMIKAMAGSHPNVPAFVAGSPKAMFCPVRTQEKKFCSVYFNLACPARTSRSAILNRGALALALVKLLEGQGMGINFKVFMSSYIRNEIFLFEIILKAPGKLLNAKKCFYPLCSREFVRRIIFRVTESVPFESGEWYPSYGMALSDGQFRNIFGLADTDMVISAPEEMGIKGENIFSDGAALFKRLGIDESVTVKLEKEAENAAG